MNCLLLGSEGMLGSALLEEGRSRGIDMIGVDMHDADHILDITDNEALSSVVLYYKPEIVINTIAITNLNECESDPGRAYMVNARPVAAMARLCKQIGAYLVQISTDHYYTGDDNWPHNETSPVELVNEYARTKFAAECFALSYPDSLVIRTNIVGFKQPLYQTFAQWVFESLIAKAPMVLFDDFYTSSIVVTQFSRIFFDLLRYRPTGVINLASREVFSKKDLIETIAGKASLSLINTSTGSVKGLIPPRAESLGLNVEKAEGILGYQMPTMDKVADELISQYRRLQNEVQ